MPQSRPPFPRPRAAFVLSLVTVVCAGLVLVQSLKSAKPSASYPPEPENAAPVACSDESENCRQVLDCSDDAKDCVVRQLTFDVDQCAEKAAREECQNFATRMLDVTLISDSYNLVSSPFSQQQVSAELISDALLLPWDLEFLPDGTMLVTEKQGRVAAIESNGEAREILQLDVIDTHEAGLMGLAIDPEFASNHYVYLAYTFKLDDTDPAFSEPKMWTHQRVLNKISRWTYDGDKLRDEYVLMDNLPGSVEHTGLRLEFGPDGKLYASTGDATNAWLSQDLAFLGGKVLRIDKDGTVPADNPFPDSYVYSRGHRNPQGMAWHPDTGALYQSEHGPYRFDEINRVVAGHNYGWGSYQCDKAMSEKSPMGETTGAAICFPHWNISPSGMTFVADQDSPWYGSLFVASLRGKHIHRYEFDGDQVTRDEIFYVSDGWDYDRHGRFGKLGRRLRDVEYWDGSLYVIGDRFGLVRLSPDSP